MIIRLIDYIVCLMHQLGSSTTGWTAASAVSACSPIMDRTCDGPEYNDTNIVIPTYLETHNEAQCEDDFESEGPSDMQATLTAMQAAVASAVGVVAEDPAFCPHGTCDSGPANPTDVYVRADAHLCTR